MEFIGDTNNNEDKRTDYIGEPVTSFEEFEKQLQTVDENGHVKKKILEEGGGQPLGKEWTVSVSFAGYWENESEPFDYTKSYKPLVRLKYIKKIVNNGSVATDDNLLAFRSRIVEHSYYVYLLP